MLHLKLSFDSPERTTSKLYLIGFWRPKGPVSLSIPNLHYRRDYRPGTNLLHPSPVKHALWLNACNSSVAIAMSLSWNRVLTMLGAVVMQLLCLLQVSRVVVLFRNISRYFVSDLNIGSIFGMGQIGRYYHQPGITIHSKFELPDELPTSANPVPPVVPGATTLLQRWSCLKLVTLADGRLWTRADIMSLLLYSACHSSAPEPSHHEHRTFLFDGLITLFSIFLILLFVFCIG